MTTKKYVLGIMVLTALASLAATVPALAQSANYAPGSRPQGAWQGRMGGARGQRGAMRPMVVGTVATVSGNTLTVTGRQGFAPNQTQTAATTFTIDASNATVRKNNATSTVSAIAVGDTVAISGTLSGTNVTATMIRDGVMRTPGMRKPGEGQGQPGAGKTQPVSPIAGNGQPVVAGTISAINGSTISITNKSNATYTVDATNAKIVQGQNTISVSNLNVGDNVVIQGAVNGNSITASSVIEETRPAGSATTATSTGQQAHRGFFGGIGHFFSHLFGF